MAGAAGIAMHAGRWSGNQRSCENDPIVRVREVPGCRRSRHPREIRSRANEKREAEHAAQHPGRSGNEMACEWEPARSWTVPAAGRRRLSGNRHLGDRFMAMWTKMTMGLSIATLVGLSMNLGLAVAEQPGMPPMGSPGGGGSGPTTGGGGGGGGSGGQPSMPGAGGGSSGQGSTGTDVVELPLFEDHATFYPVLWKDHFGVATFDQATSVIAMRLSGASLEDGTEVPVEMIADLEANGMKVHRNWLVGIIEQGKVAATATFTEAFRKDIDSMTWRHEASGSTVRHSMVAVESENAAGQSLQLYGVTQEVEQGGQKAFMFEPVGKSATKAEAAEAAAGFAKFLSNPTSTAIAVKGEQRGRQGSDELEVITMDTEKFCWQNAYEACVHRVKQELDDCNSSCEQAYILGGTLGVITCIGFTVGGTPIAGTICYVAVVPAIGVGYKRCTANCLDRFNSKLNRQVGECIVEYRKCLREHGQPLP